MKTTNIHIEYEAPEVVCVNLFRSICLSGSPSSSLESFEDGEDNILF